MRFYDYYIYGEPDAYGQPTLSSEVQGQISMTIAVASQSIQDSVLYNHAQYTGLTHDAINDKYVIQYGDEKLKVCYVGPPGRYNQVFMSRM